MKAGRMTTKLPSNEAALTDDRAYDVGTSTFPTVTGEDIVRGLVDRSGDPRSMMGPRAGTDWLCTTCGLGPYQSSQGTHEYLPMIGRTPGVHQDVDWDRARNNQTAD